MMMDIQLDNWRGERVGTLRWDPDTGTLDGAQAATVRDMAGAAVREGSIAGHPMPTQHTITDPLHDRAQMAVLLGSRWRIPASLQTDYPTTPSETDLPADAVF